MTAAFITDTEQEKMKVIHSMRMAYKIRSEFVHGSVSSLVGSNAQAELGKLSSEVDSYVRRALRKAFSMKILIMKRQRKIRNACESI